VPGTNESINTAEPGTVVYDRERDMIIVKCRVSKSGITVK